MPPSAPTFADVIAAIEEEATGAPADKSVFWTCALRRLAESLGQPVSVMPAHGGQVWERIERLQPIHLQCGAKTLANYKSAAKAALRWFDHRQLGPSSRRTAAADPAWSALFAPVKDPLRRRLTNFVRYCSDRGIAPEAVSESVLDAYVRYRAETIDLPYERAERRCLARAWNTCAGMIPGWPPITLALPDDARQTGPDWSLFPASLQQEVEAYFESLLTTRRTADGKRVRPAKPSSVGTRRRELQSFAR